MIWPPKHLAGAEREDWEYEYGRPRRGCLLVAILLAAAWLIGVLAMRCG